MAQITVIVPIYNAEATLKSCIDSIVNQTFKDIDILLIDDGSTDGSPAICDEYSQKYSNIKVIHKKNGGTGKAYNLGITFARGEYIGFVEADDLIDANMYELMYENAKKYNSDLVKCGIKIFNYSTGAITVNTEEMLILQEATKKNRAFNIFEFEQFLFYRPSVWSGLYKRELIKQLRFSETPDASFQGFSLSVKALVKAKRISTIDNMCYTWTIGKKNTSASSKTDKSLIKIVEQAKIAKEFLEENGCYEKLFSAFNKLVISAFFNFYRNTERQYKQEFFMAIKEFFSNILPKNINETVQYFTRHQIQFLLFVVSGKFEETLDIPSIFDFDLKK